MERLIYAAIIIFIGLIIYKKYKKMKRRNKNLKDNNYTLNSFI